MNHTDSNIESRVRAALEQIRPYLNADGGDIELVEITGEMHAIVRLSGACSTCNKSYQTMTNGVQQMVRRMVPEIVAVEALTATR